MLRAHLSKFLIILAVSSCGADHATSKDMLDPSKDTLAPLIGADGTDAADRACNITLRSLARVPSNGGFETACVDGRCWLVFAGTIDISAQASAEGARPFILFKNQDAANWSEVEATASTEAAPAGFVRFSVRLTRETIAEGLSGTGMARAQISIAPYLRTTTGARLFDKQRGQGDFDNYELKAETNFAVSDSPLVCPASAPTKSQLDFQNGWRTQQHGALVQGGSLTINYAIERLPACRSTHNGFPAWDIRGFVRFQPSGVVAEGTVRGFDGPVPSNASAHAVPLTVEIPAGSTSADVWFQNYSGAGSSCESWDSNEGNNYRFAVEPAPFARVQWVGNAGSSFARDCGRRDGVPSPAILDSYVQQRACAFIEVDVYVPGLTDGPALRSEGLWARAALQLDGAPLDPQWLTFTGRVGNDYRMHFEVPKSNLYYGPKWTTLTYALEFSTDGINWVSDEVREIKRDVSFCNPAWGSCEL